MTGTQVGADGGEGTGQIFDRHIADILLQQAHQPVAADQSPGNLEVEIAQQIEPVETPRPCVQCVEMAGQVDPADQRADRCAADDVEADPSPLEGLDHADMCPATGGAAAEG